MRLAKPITLHRARMLDDDKINSGPVETAERSSGGLVSTANTSAAERPRKDIAICRQPVSAIDAAHPDSGCKTNAITYTRVLRRNTDRVYTWEAAR